MLPSDTCPGAGRLHSPRQPSTRILHQEQAGGKPCRSESIREHCFHNGHPHSSPQIAEPGDQSPPTLEMSPAVPEPGPGPGSRDGLIGVRPCKEGSGWAGSGQFCSPARICSSYPGSRAAHPLPSPQFGCSSAQRYFAENCPALC